jgi:putative lipoic acid-binding regulatory protein
MIDNQPHHNELSTDPLGIADPWGEYEFSMEIDAEGYKEPHEMRHLLFATRTYTDVANISGVYPFNTDVAALIEQLLHTHAVDPETGERIDNDGVKITVVLKSDPTGHYTPVDILINETSINQFDVSEGFWRLNSRLVQLINRQTPGLIHEQVSYTGQKYDTASPLRAVRHPQQR